MGTRRISSLQCPAQSQYLFARATGDMHAAQSLQQTFPAKVGKGLMAFRHLRDANGLQQLEMGMCAQMLQHGR